MGSNLQLSSLSEQDDSLKSAFEIAIEDYD